MTLIRIILLLIATALPSSAHRLNVFATVEGSTISGYAYLSGGTRAREVPVSAIDTAGEVLASTVTDNQGVFSFPAPCRCDLTIVVESGDGHRGTWTIRKETLPAELSPGPENAAGNIPDDSFQIPGKPEPRQPADTDLAMLREQVRELAEQLDRMQNEIRLRDILAGIGFLLGGAGIWAWAATRRKADRRG